MAKQSSPRTGQSPQSSPKRSYPKNRKSRAGYKIGSKGCPSCGSHDTDHLRVAGAQWCNTCGHRWVPCDTAFCRGYEIDITGEFPEIRGCKGCGVPTRIARWWPEAHRAVYRALLERDKLEAIED